MDLVVGLQFKKREMGLIELLEKIRDYYLTRFKQEIDYQRSKGFETIIEPEYLSESGDVITEGFFDTPYRNDLFLVKENKVTDSIMGDTVSKLSFDPIVLQWSDSLVVNIEPFQWNYMTIEFEEINERFDWTPLKNWFMVSFEPKTMGEDFYSVVHYISDPYPLNGKQMVDIDLGSGTIEDLMTLFDALNEMSSTHVTIK